MYVFLLNDATTFTCTMYVFLLNDAGVLPLPVRCMFPLMALFPN